MNRDSLIGFVAGLGLGAAVTLAVSYFHGTFVLRKTLKEHDHATRPPKDSAQHLFRAQEILNEAPTPPGSIDDVDDLEIM